VRSAENSRCRTIKAETPRYRNAFRLNRRLDQANKTVGGGIAQEFDDVIPVFNDHGHTLAS